MCLSALSSQRRVPNEVWEIIFTTLCTTLHDYSFKLDYYYGISNQTNTYKTILLEIPSLVLTHVCSRWRGIAMSLPHLWSSLSIKFNELPFDITVPLELYLSRSQESPLSIRITRLAQYPLCGLSEVGLAAWQKLASGFRRCKNLTSPSPSSTFRDSKTYHFPNSKRFTRNRSKLTPSDGFGKA
ncbi:hypothetical protein AAF712_006331 [Marasmius tenuissimus]|uniref:F-box domain-containing protein n=1 Tax=Marasmius tenuissimus TaxID=585030 RepID=A0ABR2ZYC2_9AGAR